MQASSFLTEAALLSPRSMESSCTKVNMASPACPTPLPLPDTNHNPRGDQLSEQDHGAQPDQASAVFPSHDSLPVSFPVDDLKPRADCASMQVYADGMQAQAHSGPDPRPALNTQPQGSSPAAEVAVLAEAEVRHSPERAGLLQVPFRAAHLQKLAHAAIGSKKVSMLLCLHLSAQVMSPGFGTEWLWSDGVVASRQLDISSAS